MNDTIERFNFYDVYLNIKSPWSLINFKQLFF